LQAPGIECIYDKQQKKTYYRFRPFTSEKRYFRKIFEKLNLRIEDLANELEEIEFNGIKYYRRS